MFHKSTSGLSRSADLVWLGLAGLSHAPVSWLEAGQPRMGPPLLMSLVIRIAWACSRVDGRIPA